MQTIPNVPMQKPVDKVGIKVKVQQGVRVNTAEEAIEWAEQYIQKFCQGKQKEFMPTFVILKQGMVAAVDCPWTNEEEKYRWVHAVRGVISIMQADGYIVMSEAWFAPEKEGSKLRPSQSPEREEGIFAVVQMHKSKSTLSRAYRIGRDFEGYIPDITEIKDMRDQLKPHAVAALTEDGEYFEADIASVSKDEE